MSALRYWDEKSSQTQSELLEEIFDKTYDNVIKGCKDGIVTDDNAVISAILSLMERIFPKILEAYKDDPDEYDSRCLATATALRVTISSFMPIVKFMEIMNRKEMVAIDNIVAEMADNGIDDQKEEQLINTFKGMKPSNKTVNDIYG